MSPSHTPTRSSGILAHITSLPSPYGVGDIGNPSYRFIDFLSELNQKYWQFLPLGPTHPIFDNSPYMSSSAFAGSPLLLSPDLLFEQGLLKKNDLDAVPEFSQYSTDYPKVISEKSKILKKAFSTFNGFTTDLFLDFLNNSPWLENYALYMTLKKQFKSTAWYDWPEDIITKKPEIIEKFKSQNKILYDYYRFEQYEFHRQWQLLKEYAHNSGVRLFGDIPIYVGLDSADVWANQDIFQLHPKTHLPTHVAGVPPDYFSVTGQRWGNPLYRWNTQDSSISTKLTDWWVSRFQSEFNRVDMARIDHFRGFESYWSIPSVEKTAINGEWVKGPGKKFFQSIFQELGKVDIIAEDLGLITKEVRDLRDEMEFPGMKILQFAFDGNLDNAFLPHNFKESNCVIYTGTHDNDTSLGWYLSDKNTHEGRQKIANYTNRSIEDSRDIHKDMIYLALSSIAFLSIIPLQDVLGFGNDCRMNIPGTDKGNWSWRCSEEFLQIDSLLWLKEMTKLFGRATKIDEPSSPIPNGSL